MTFGFCHLSLVPVRAIDNDRAEMVTQLLFGDVFEITDKASSWVKIKIGFDDYEGWIDVKQYLSISSDQFSSLKQQELRCLTDLVEYVEAGNRELTPIVIGSSIYASTELEYQFDANTSSGEIQREKIIPTALLYLNSPYL